MSRPFEDLPPGVPVAQVADVLGVVEEVLGPDVLGVYLYGSAVAGGLQHRSDLDLLVVLDALPDRESRAALVAALLPVARRAGVRADDRSLELTAVVRSDAVPWRYPPRRAFQYGEWHRDDYLAGMVPEPVDDPDLAVLLTMVLADGVALVGPVPSRVLAPVPPADLRRAVVDVIPGLEADLDWDTANVVLTMARVWVTLATGEIRGKDAAAAWALERLPADARPVLERALGVYLGTDDDRWDDLADRIRPSADALLASIREASPT